MAAMLTQQTFKKCKKGKKTNENDEERSFSNAENVHL